MAMIFTAPMVCRFATRSASAKDSPLGAGVPLGSQVSGDILVELSRVSAMRMVTAVTRPTMVASTG